MEQEVGGNNCESSLYKQAHLLSLGDSNLWSEWGKPIFEMCCFRISIAQIALDPPPLPLLFFWTLFIDLFFYIDKVI